ncbi:MAG: hypothetical protein WAU45_16760 [Blastocatellia bacterium]
MWLSMLMLCPICAGEFELSAPDCPSCGCNLVASTMREDVLSDKEADERCEFVEMCRSQGGYPVAALIKQTLEQNGVTAIIQGGHFMSVMPSLAVGGELRVLVPRHQLEYARALYEAYFEGGESDFAPEDDEA